MVGLNVVTCVGHWTHFRLEVSVLHSYHLRCYNWDFDFCVDEE